MNAPTQFVHDVASVSIGETRVILHDDGVPFAVRDITICRDDGLVLTMRLFASSSAALTILTDAERAAAQDGRA